MSPCPDCGLDEAQHLDADECEERGLDSRDGWGCAVRGPDGVVARALRQDEEERMMEREMRRVRDYDEGVIWSDDH